MAVAFPFVFGSSLAAITYLSSRNVPELTKYKLCKLIFLADKYHLVTYGRVITGDKYCAVPHGPIPSRILNLLNEVISGNLRSEESQKLAISIELDRQFENPRFRSLNIAEPAQLSQSDFAALDKVIGEYGTMGFGELKAITHEMFAYKQAWNDRPHGANGVDMDFEAFFEEDSDAVVGARDAMIEDDALRKAFPEF